MNYLHLIFNLFDHEKISGKTGIFMQNQILTEFILFYDGRNLKLNICRDFITWN